MLFCPATLRYWVFPSAECQMLSKDPTMVQAGLSSIHSDSFILVFTVDNTVFCYIIICVQASERACVRACVNNYEYAAGEGQVVLTQSDF